MRKIKLLVIIALLPVLAKSQDTVHIPVPVARQIAKDLVTYDSLKDVHTLIVDQLKLTEDKVVLKDSIIDSYKQKCNLYDTMIANDKKMFDTQGKWVKDLKKDIITLSNKKELDTDDKITVLETELKQIEVKYNQLVEEKNLLQI